MVEYAWPVGDWFSRLGHGWAAAVRALPVGAVVSGVVVGRQPFGVFVRFDDVPDAVGLAEITAMPRSMKLPPMGASVTATVIWHAEHNHQVRLRLTEWHD
ncbi:hypothetical protein ACTWP5_25385 [Streptomyces sp. 4N509B]|uniref:hypothetical protein n=1 Tax=Streptomyces sp. 4N509B TaxID=3457413 RepID=UPI003FCFBAD5